MTSVPLSSCFPFNQNREPMSKECALTILEAEKLYGKGTMRPEYLEEAKRVLGMISPHPSEQGA